MNFDFNFFSSKLLPAFRNVVRDNFYIGLEISLNSLNLVQMEHHAGKIDIRAIFTIALPCSRDELQKNPKILKDLLKQAYKAQPFKGKRVVSCLPNDQIKIITLTYKHTDGQDDSVAVIAELYERYKDELDNLVVDFMTLRHEEYDSNFRNAIVAVAPREEVIAYLELLANAGLCVEALDIGPAALARLVTHAGAIKVPEYPKLPNVLLINFGLDSSFLTIIWGRRLMLDRQVEFSEMRMFDRIKLALDMPEGLIKSLLYDKYINIESESLEQEDIKQTVKEVLRPEFNLLLQEVNKTLTYMASNSRGKSVDQVYLTGSVARYPGMLSFLREQLNLPIDTLDPIEVFSANKYFSNSQSLGVMPGIVLSTGLALRGISENA